MSNVKNELKIIEIPIDNKSSRFFECTQACDFVSRIAIPSWYRGKEINCPSSKLQKRHELSTRRISETGSRSGIYERVSLHEPSCRDGDQNGGEIKVLQPERVN